MPSKNVKLRSSIFFCQLTSYYVKWPDTSVMMFNDDHDVSWRYFSFFDVLWRFWRILKTQKNKMRVFDQKWRKRHFLWSDLSLFIVIEIIGRYLTSFKRQMNSTKIFQHFRFFSIRVIQLPLIALLPGQSKAIPLLILKKIDQEHNV